MTWLRALLRKRFRLRRDRAGFTLVELVVGLIVIATASVGTTIAFYTAYGSLAEQRHRLRANDLLRAEMEFWMGRIHASGVFPGQLERQLPTEWEEVLIDPRGPGSGDDIWGAIRRERIVGYNISNGEMDPDRSAVYYKIILLIRWWEPSRIPGEPAFLIEQHLEGYWLKSQ